MMKKPVIAVAPQYDFDKNHLRIDPLYFTALQQSGMLPVLLPLEQSAQDIAQTAALFDGFLFPGGPDFLPELFGEEPLRGCGRVDARRDALEIPLARAAIDAQKPVLGICRGAQLLNIALGGDIWQDLPSQMPDSLLHDQQRPFDAPVHRVTLAPDTLLAEIEGADSLLVNSIHHQAVRRVAQGLTAAAHTADGVVEAVCGPKTGPFLLGVQWHPEQLFAARGDARAIFAAFAKACGA